MRTIALPFLSLLSLLSAVHAQNSITCEPQGTVLCQGSTVVLDYTATGSFEASNMFQAWLSDENGSFDTPSIIGQNFSMFSGQIICLIPVDAAPGIGYRMRVDGSEPSTTGEPSSMELTIIAAPNAGSDGSLAICSDGFPVILETTGADPGGTWFDPAGDPVTPPIFVPGVSTPGCYSYVVPGSAPCVSDTATLCITVPTAPNAGMNSTVIVCSTDAPFIMLPHLNGSPQPGGTWTDPAGAVHSGIFNPVVDIPGCYAYTVAGEVPCADATAILCISVSQAADAGISALDTVCVDGPPVNMFEQLDGAPQAGGNWSFQGAPHAPFFIPGVDPEGCYHYVVQGTAPCLSDSSTWCVILDPCLNTGLGAISTLNDGLRQIDGWGTERPVFAFGAVQGARAKVIDALGRQVFCPLLISERDDAVLISLDLSSLARGGYWLVVGDGTHSGTLRIPKW